MRFERIRGERADDFISIGERATQARMHAIVRVQCADDVAVEGVGQFRIGRELNRFLAAQDDVEARLFAAIVAPAQRTS